MLANLDLGDWIGAEGEAITSRRRRALGRRDRAVAAVQGPAPAARQVARADRHRHPLPPAGGRPPGQPGQPPGVRHPLQGHRRPASPAGGRGLRRGRHPDTPAPGRRRAGPAVHDPRQCPRHRPQPAHRPRALPQAPGGGGVRAGVRDRPQLPQRGRRHPAQPGVHRPRGLPGLRRCHRRHGPHRAADRGGGPVGHRPADLHRRGPGHRPHPSVAPAIAARLARGDRRPPAPSRRSGRGRPRRSATSTASTSCPSGVRGS